MRYPIHQNPAKMRICLTNTNSDGCEGVPEADSVLIFEIKWLTTLLCYLG